MRQHAFLIAAYEIIEWAHSSLYGKDFEGSLDELADILGIEEANYILLLHALDLLTQRLFPELADIPRLSHIVNFLTPASENGSPSRPVSRYRANRLPGSSIPNSCIRHPHVMLKIEEDFIKCESCNKYYCKLLCSEYMVCSMCLSSYGNCLCSREKFHCKLCDSKSA